MSKQDDTPWPDLVEWRPDVVVVDLSMPPAPHRARRIGPLAGRLVMPEIQCNLEHTLAPLVDQYADLVLLCPPAPSLIDGHAAVVALKRILRSGGRVLLEIPQPSPTPEVDWRAALESEHIWIDEDATYTWTGSPSEYMGWEQVVPKEKDANFLRPCYRRLSGIK